jgi:hypothetical protein
MIIIFEWAPRLGSSVDIEFMVNPLVVDHAKKPDMLATRPSARWSS